MAKKDINIFSVSFLDLLSGALAAVIILFIVVPKLTTDAREASEKLQELDLQAQELDSIVSNLANSVPRGELDVLQQYVDEMEENIDDLGLKVRNIEEENDRLNGENEELQQELDSTKLALSQTEITLDLARDSIKVLEQQIAELTRQDSTEPPAQSQGRGPGQVLFGTNADFAIYYSWEEDWDFDLHLVNLDKDETCYYHNKSTSFAELLDDVQKSTADSYELIYTKEGKIVPGKYLLKVRVYSEGKIVEQPKGVMVIFPGKANEHAIELATRTYRHTEKPVNVLEFTLTETDFIITRTY